MESSETGPAAEALPYARRLHAFFRRRGHAADADDLVQELFVFLLSKEGAVDASAPRPFRSFLFAVAYRLGANASRRRARRQERPIADASEAPAPAADPERRALAREEGRRVAEALESLPIETRRTLLLVATEGKSVSEAARILGVREEAVRARLSRGRRRLGALLVAVVLAGAALLARRPAPVEARYVVTGDSTGIVLTGPGVARRSEAVWPPARPKGEIR